MKILYCRNLSFIKRTIFIELTSHLAAAPPIFEPRTLASFFLGTHFMQPLDFHFIKYCFYHRPFTLAQRSVVNTGQNEIQNERNVKL